MPALRWRLNQLNVVAFRVLDVAYPPPFAVRHVVEDRVGYEPDPLALELGRKLCKVTDVEADVGCAELMSVQVPFRAWWVDKVDKLKDMLTVRLSDEY